MIKASAIRGTSWPLLLGGWGVINGRNGIYACSSHCNVWRLNDSRWSQTSLSSTIKLQYHVVKSIKLNIFMVLKKLIHNGINCKMSWLLLYLLLKHFNPCLVCPIILKHLEIIFERIELLILYLHQAYWKILMVDDNCVYPFQKKLEG